MASKPANQLSTAQKEQLAVSYAAFVLSGQGAQVTADSINNVLKAANISASSVLVKAFAKTLATRKVTEFIGSVGGGSGGSAPAAEAKTETKAKDAPKDNKDAGKGKEKDKPAPPPPPPAQQQEQMDMGGLFD